MQFPRIKSIIYGFLIAFSLGASISTQAQTLTIANNSGQVAAASVSQGVTNWLLLKAQLTITGPGYSAVTGLSCITSGSYAAADVVNLKVWYSASATFRAGSCTLLSTLSAPGTAGTKTFPSMNPAYFSGGTAVYGSTGYLFITADLDPNATTGNTISINALSSSLFTISAGIITGTTTAGGIQTIVDGTLADNLPQTASANVAVGNTDVLLHQSSIACGATARTLTGMTCTTAGTYSATDVAALKVYYSTSNAFSIGSAVLLSTLASPGTAGAKTFPSFVAQVIPANTFGYIYITADVSLTATVNNRINVTALNTSNFTFSSGSLTSGSTAAGGQQTFIAATASLFDNGTQPAPATVLQGASNVVLHQSQLVFSNTTRWSMLSFSTSGTYAASDISRIKLYTSGSSTFSAGSSNLLAQIDNPGAAGGKIAIPGLQQASSGSTYLYITADIAPTATVGNTISVNGFTGSNFTGGGGVGCISGVTTDAGLQTIGAIFTPTINLFDNGFQVTAGNVVQGATEVLLHQGTLAVSSGSFATITGMNITTAGTYQASDLTNLKLYFSTYSVFSPVTSTLVSVLSSSGVAGAQVFPSFTQYVLDGTLGFFYITADVAPAATVGNTFSVNTLSSANFTITTGFISGSTTTGERRPSWRLPRSSLPTTARRSWPPALPSVTPTGSVINQNLPSPSMT